MTRPDLLDIEALGNVANVEERRVLFFTLGATLMDDDGGQAWLYEACEALLEMAEAAKKPKGLDTTGLDTTGRDRTRRDVTRQDSTGRDAIRPDKTRPDL